MSQANKQPKKRKLIICDKSIRDLKTRIHKAYLERVEIQLPVKYGRNKIEKKVKKIRNI